MKDYPVGNDLAYYLYWVYYCAINSFPLMGEWIHPWYNYQVMETLYMYSLDQANFKAITAKGGSVSDIILKHVHPDLHDVVKPLRLPEMKELGYRRVSERLLNKAFTDYKNSWYGNKFDIKPDPLMDYNEWWGSWNLASLCEHLLSEGYEIE
jgi:hypothetical protein